MKISFKKSLLAISIFGFAFLFAGCAKKSQSDSNVLNVYTYDSFISEWGPGDGIAKAFENSTGIKINWVDCGDGAQILSKAIAEKKSPQADIFLGLDNNLVKMAVDADVLVSYKPSSANKIIDGLEDALGGNWYLTPYDYSHFAMIFDSKSNVPCPASLQDLTKPEYAKKIILMDPRTSTPGLGFAAWTVAAFGDGYKDYWKELKKNILTMADGWSSGYGLFTAGEAPLCLSYTTSPAYHIEYGEGHRFKAVVFEQGHVLQVEGAGIAKNAKNLENAKKFIDFLNTVECQKNIPLTQWMFPSSKEIELPESYISGAPVPETTLEYNPQSVAEAVPVIMEILAE